MSHLLFGGTAAFRHGAGALDDVTSAKSAAQRAAQPLVTVLGAESADAPHPAPAAELTSSASVKPAPDAMDAAGQNGSGCVYPTVPFYGLLNELEVTMELPDRSARALAPVLDRTLQATMREAGRVYYLGSQSALQDPDMRLATAAVGSEPPTGGQLRLSYGAYVSALMDGLAQFTLLRSATPTTKRLVTPHTLHVRLGGHPRWKDVSLMLALECGQLVLYVSASSRLTQQFLTTRAARLSLELVWLAGATMVEEPRALQTTDINPVLVLWDCFMALPLLSTAPAAITTTTTTMVNESGQRRAEAQAELAGFYVALVSSLPILGAEQHGVGLRLVKETVRQSSEEEEAQVPRNSSGGGDGAGHHRRRSRPLGRRLTWRLVADSGAGGVGVVLPHLFTHLIHNLVQLTRAVRPSFGASAGTEPSPTQPVLGFDVVCGGDARASKSRVTGAQQWWRTRYEGTSAPARRTTVTTATEPALTRPQGLTYVTAHRGIAGRAGAGGGLGGGQAFAPTQSVSSQSWLGFSRLSCAGWVRAGERLATDLDDDEECEFNLLWLRYRPSVCSDDAAAELPGHPTRKRGRSSSERVAGDAADGVVDATDWEAAFDWGVEVTRIMAYASSESGEDDDR